MGMSPDEKTAAVIEWLEGAPQFSAYKWRSISLDYKYGEILGGGSYDEFVTLFDLADGATPSGVSLSDPELDIDALDGFVEMAIDTLAAWDWDEIENHQLERIRAAIEAGNETKREIHAWLVANDRYRETVRYLNKTLYRFEGKQFAYDVVVEGAAPRWRVLNPTELPPPDPRWAEIEPDFDCPLEMDFDRWESLRGWQRDAIRRWAANGHRGLVEAVTGSGKTNVGIAVIEHCVTVGERVLVLTPNNSLKDQWAQRLRAEIGAPLGVKITEISTGKSPKWASARVILAHPTSTKNAIKTGVLDPSTIGCVIVDEVHLGGPAWRSALSESIPARLGLSATLERNEDFDEALAPYFDGVIYEYGFSRAYGDGYIAPFRLAYLGCAFSSDEQEEYDEAVERFDKARRELAKLVPELNRAQESDFYTILGELARSTETSRESIAASKAMKALSDQRELRAGCTAKFDALKQLLDVSGVRRRGIVFTQTKAAAQQVLDTCGQAGVACRLITGDTPVDERRAILDAFRAGEFQILVGPKVLNQGIDVPEVDFAVVVAASKSASEMKQRFGRALRLKEDGRDAAIAVMYVIGTPEAPDYSDGPRDGFMSELEDFCDPEARTFFADRDLDDAVAFLSETSRAL